MATGRIWHVTAAPLTLPSLNSLSLPVPISNFRFPASLSNTSLPNTANCFHAFTIERLNMEDDEYSWLASFSHEDGLQEIDTLLSSPEPATESPPQLTDTADRSNVPATLELDHSTTDEMTDADAVELLVDVLDDAERPDEAAVKIKDDLHEPAPPLLEQSNGCDDDASHESLDGRSGDASTEASLTSDSTRDAVDIGEDTQQPKPNNNGSGTWKPFPSNPYIAHQTSVNNADQVMQPPKASVPAREEPLTPTTQSIMASLAPRLSSDKSQLHTEMRSEKHDAVLPELDDSPVNPGNKLFGQTGVAQRSMSETAAPVQDSLDVEPLKRARPSSSPFASPKHASKKQALSTHVTRRNKRPVTFALSSNRTRSKTAMLASQANSTKENLSQRPPIAKDEDTTHVTKTDSVMDDEDAMTSSELPEEAQVLYNTETVMEDAGKANIPKAVAAQPKKAATKQTNGKSLRRSTRIDSIQAQAPTESPKLDISASDMAEAGIGDLVDESIVQPKKTAKTTKKKTTGMSGKKQARAGAMPAKANIASIPRQTRHAKKIFEDSRPDAASVAKRRHSKGVKE